MSRPHPLADAVPLTLDVAQIQKPLPKIVRAGDPVLRTAAATVDPARIKTAEMQALVHTMVQVMREAPGVGLAAPQIGIGLRVIVVEDRPSYTSKMDAEAREARRREAVPLLALFNPELTRVRGSGKATYPEGCLSVPGYSAEVSRELEVEVRGLDIHGAPVHLLAVGWAARIFQHEVDHLKGTLYVDKMNPRTLCAEGS
jgi:peptide deformylase